MQNRVKHLRKELNLSQAKFAEKIGLGQRAVASIESGSAKLTDRNFDTICRVFNVNPEWLRSGVGEMFNSSNEKSFLDKLAEEKGLEAKSKALIQSIIDLPAGVREGVIDWALNLARELNSKNSNPLEEELQKLRVENVALKKYLAEITQANNYLAETTQKKFFQDGKTDETLSRKEKHELVDEELDKTEKNQMSSASISTSGQAKKNSS